MENYASPYWKIIDRSYRQDEQEAMARFAREQQLPSPNPNPDCRIKPEQLDRLARDMGFTRTWYGWALRSEPDEDIEF
jgi:hypothetical protein